MVSWINWEHGAHGRGVEGEGRGREEKIEKCITMALKLWAPRCLCEEVKHPETPYFSGCWRSQHASALWSPEPVWEQVVFYEGNALYALHRDALTARHSACHSKGTSGGLTLPYLGIESCLPAGMVVRTLNPSILEEAKDRSVGVPGLKTNGKNCLLSTAGR